MACSFLFSPVALSDAPSTERRVIVFVNTISSHFSIRRSRAGIFGIRCGFNFAPFVFLLCTSAMQTSSIAISLASVNFVSSFWLGIARKRPLLVLRTSDADTKSAKRKPAKQEAILSPHRKIVFKESAAASWSPRQSDFPGRSGSPSPRLRRADRLSTTFRAPFAGFGLQATVPSGNSRCPDCVRRRFDAVQTFGLQRELVPLK